MELRRGKLLFSLLLWQLRNPTDPGGDPSFICPSNTWGREWRCLSLSLFPSAKLSVSLLSLCLELGKIQFPSCLRLQCRLLSVPHLLLTAATWDSGEILSVLPSRGLSESISAASLLLLATYSIFASLLSSLTSLFLAFPPPLSWVFCQCPWLLWSSSISWGGDFAACFISSFLFPPETWIEFLKRQLLRVRISKQKFFALPYPTHLMLLNSYSLPRAL